MTPAHPETEETTFATINAMATPVQPAPPVRPVSLAEDVREGAWAVWEAIELWWLEFLARLIARGEDVPLCPCCEAKICGLREGRLEGGSLTTRYAHRSAHRSPMGVYLAAAPGLSARARRHLARGIAGYLRAMRACGESWGRWVCDRLQTARARAAGTAASGQVSGYAIVAAGPLRVGAGRGPPGHVHIIDTESCSSPLALGHGRFGLRRGQPGQSGIRMIWHYEGRQV